MLQAVINTASLLHRRLCGKLHGGLSHLLFAGPARRRSIASYITDDCDLCLPHLHLTRPLGGPFWNIAMTFGTEKLERFGYQTVKKIWRYVYSFWQNPQTWWTDRRRDGHHMTTEAARMHSIAGPKWISFDANWHKWPAGQWHATAYVMGQEVKGQGYTRTKSDS